MSVRKFAAFDLDGTLIRWQLYHAIVDKLAKSGELGKDAHKQLHKARMVWKNREHPDAFKEYEMALIKIYEQAFPNLDVNTFDKLVHDVIGEYKDQVYTYTRDLIKKLKMQNYFLLAISGSHKELVKEIADYYGFDDCVGTEYDRKQGKFSGKKFIASRDKKAVLEQLVKKHTLSFENSIAVGDSASDVAMLELVEKPIAFNPDQSLLKTAQKNAWKIVVERKNVVYELESKNGIYILE